MNRRSRGHCLPDYGCCAADGIDVSMNVRSTHVWLVTLGLASVDTQYLLVRQQRSETTWQLQRQDAPAVARSSRLRIVDSRTDASLMVLRDSNYLTISTSERLLSPSMCRWVMRSTPWFGKPEALLTRIKTYWQQRQHLAMTDVENKTSVISCTAYRRLH